MDELLLCVASPTDLRVEAGEDAGQAIELEDLNTAGRRYTNDNLADNTGFIGSQIPTFGAADTGKRSDAADGLIILGGGMNAALTESVVYPDLQFCLSNVLPIGLRIKANRGPYEGNSTQNPSLRTTNLGLEVMLADPDSGYTGSSFCALSCVLPSAHVPHGGHVVPISSLAFNSFKGKSDGAFCPGLPTGGMAAQVLKKNSTTDFDAGWAAESGLPASTAADDLLKGDGTAGWEIHAPGNAGDVLVMDNYGDMVWQNHVMEASHASGADVAGSATYATNAGLATSATGLSGSYTADTGATIIGYVTVLIGGDYRRLAVVDPTP
jgi:hypothetical protein